MVLRNCMIYFLLLDRIGDRTRERKQLMSYAILVISNVGFGSKLMYIYIFILVHICSYFHARFMESQYFIIMTWNLL